MLKSDFSECETTHILYVQTPPIKGLREADSKKMEKRYQVSTHEKKTGMMTLISDRVDIRGRKQPRTAGAT